jgi:hypothetical protein
MGGYSDTPSLEKILQQGFDPNHAVYIFIQNLVSHFSELVSQLPEMRKFAKIVGEAEEEYMPSGPPMSPLTSSYFTSWAFFDLQFDGGDTLAKCLIEANDIVWMNSDQLIALQKMSDSRMGVYQHFGREDGHVRLRELVTGDDFTCNCTSGYRGTKGELWYARLLPPLDPEMGHYHTVFTTPYVLIETKPEDWTQFFQRSLPGVKDGEQRTALHQFLKHGSDANYWNEYVFKAYVNHQYDAIFLTGIPDLNATLPHA